MHANQRSHGSEFGVLFYLFAGRARPIILDFNDNDGDDHKTANTDDDNEKHVVRFTNSTPKLPILKAPRSAQWALTESNVARRSDANNNAAPFSPSSLDNQQQQQRIVADKTMKALQKVILIDVLRRASYDPTDNNSTMGHLLASGADDGIDESEQDDGKDEERQSAAEDDNAVDKPQKDVVNAQNHLLLSNANSDNKNENTSGLIDSPRANSSVGAAANQADGANKQTDAGAAEKTSPAAESPAAADDTDNNAHQGDNASIVEPSHKDDHTDEKKRQEEDDDDEQYADDTVPEEEQQSTTKKDDGDEVTAAKEGNSSPTKAAKTATIATAATREPSLNNGAQQNNISSTTETKANQKKERKQKANKIRLNPNDLVLTEDLLALMKGKDITILAMVPSRDCRARAHRTAASQQRVNPHKLLLRGGGASPSGSSTTTTTPASRSHKNNNSPAVSFQQQQQQHLGGGGRNLLQIQQQLQQQQHQQGFAAGGDAGGRFSAPTKSFATGFVGAGGFVPSYMGSLRRVVVSTSSKRIVSGGSAVYKPARTSLTPSAATSLNNTQNSLALTSVDFGSSDFASNSTTTRVIGGAVYKTTTSASSSSSPKKATIRQQFGADSGVFSAANALIDPNNPNLMLCSSLETLLRDLSPFCFASLDEVHFRTRPSAARGEDADVATFAALNELHSSSSSGGEEEGGNNAGGRLQLQKKQKRSSSPPQKYTIPPCMLFGRGRDGDRNGSHAHDSITETDLDPDAVTVRGYPVLMSERDAFSLCNFISYAERRLMPRAERLRRERERRAKKESIRKLAEVVMVNSDGRERSRSPRAGGGFREDDAAPLHPRLFAAAEVVAGSSARARAHTKFGMAMPVPSKNTVNNGMVGQQQQQAAQAVNWFDMRPLEPLQLHMEWLSGTRLWVPTTAAKAKGGRNGQHRKDGGGSFTMAKKSEISSAQQTTEKEKEEAAYFSAIYNEDVSQPLAPIMHPPPPLIFPSKANKKTPIAADASAVRPSPLRRKGQAELLKDPSWGNPYYKQTGTAVLLGGRGGMAMIKAAAVAANESEKDRRRASSSSAVVGVCGGDGGQVSSTTNGVIPPAAPPLSSVTVPPTSPPQQKTATPSAFADAVGGGGGGVATAVGSAAGGSSSPRVVFVADNENANAGRATAVNVASSAPSSRTSSPRLPVPSPRPLSAAPSSSAAAAVNPIPIAAPPPPPAPQQAFKGTSGGGALPEAKKPRDHPLLKLLLTQRIQDHLDYLATQEECYRRQVVWRAQLEGRRILLLSFVKEREEIEGVTRELEEVLFHKKRLHDRQVAEAVAAASSFSQRPTTGGNNGNGSRQIAAASGRRYDCGSQQQMLNASAASVSFMNGSYSSAVNVRHRKALIEPSPLVQKLRGMIGVGQQ